MFITEEDYKVVIGDNALKVISQVSPENRTNAEAEAREEIAGYLTAEIRLYGHFLCTG